MDINELFEEDPDKKNKYKELLPKNQKDLMIFDYFDKNANKNNNNSNAQKNS